MDDKDKLLDDVFKYRKAVILLSAASTGLFDFFIEKQVLTVSDVREKFGWPIRGTEIFLNALCATGYIKKQKSQYEIAENYKSVFSADNYLLMKEWLLHEWRLLHRWIHLPDVLENGEPYREPEKIAVHRNHRNFILSMAHREKENLPVLLNAIDLHGYSHLLDLGGGPGLFAINFAEKYPDLKATIFDTPESESLARDFIRKSPARNRVTFRGGDFLKDDFGSDFDVALLSSILHIYGPDDNFDVLSRVFHSLRSGGKILIRDFLLKPDKTGPQIGVLFAVNMLVNTDRGNAYTYAEMKSWLLKTGFRRIRKIRLEGRMLLLEAHK
jgi:ubiquinone/menaquinone biosynthesis C-methylase UbiE